MSRIPAANDVARQAASSGGPNDLRDVEVDKFLDLLIAELQNQDPLNPMDNSEMVQQISQIREISATNQLSDTLSSVVLGQNVATASSLIGKRINALTDDAKNVEGVVDRVSMEKDDTDESKRVIRVYIGDHKIDVSNIREIASTVEGA
jgi:flagellar basal-body rod modification protein FlgD